MLKFRQIKICHILKCNLVAGYFVKFYSHHYFCPRGSYLYIHSNTYSSTSQWPTLLLALPNDYLLPLPLYLVYIHCVLQARDAITAGSIAEGWKYACLSRILARSSFIL